jgi:hypothetical protein
MFTEEYNKVMREEIDELELDAPLSHAHKTAFIHGYKLASHHWHSRGLIEGWNDHIKKLNQIMEPILVEDKLRTKNS